MISDVLAEATEKMNKAVEVCKDDFATVRTTSNDGYPFHQAPGAWRTLIVRLHSLPKTAVHR